MKILGMDIKVTTTLSNEVMLLSQDPDDVPLIDFRNLKIETERKDGKVIVVIRGEAGVDEEELKRRIESGRLVLLKGGNNDY